MSSFESFGESALGSFRQSPLGARDSFGAALRIVRQDTKGVHPVSFTDLGIGAESFTLVAGFTAVNFDGDGGIIWGQIFDGDEWRLVQHDAVTGALLISVPLPFPEPPPHLNANLTWDIAGDSDVLYARTRLTLGPLPGVNADYIIKLSVPDFTLLKDSLVVPMVAVWGIHAMSGGADKLWFITRPTSSFDGTPAVIGELSTRTLEVLRTASFPFWTNTMAEATAPHAIAYDAEGGLFILVQRRLRNPIPPTFEQFINEVDQVELVSARSRDYGDFPTGVPTVWAGLG